MTTAQAESTIPTGTWRSDPVHSHVGFAVTHNQVATFRGSFSDFDAELSDEVGGPKLRGAVRAGSVQVPDEDLRAHLLSPDFFDGERYPEITFESTSIRADGDDLIVEGELTIRGETMAVEARGRLTGPATGMGEVEKVGLELETAVDRTEFGLNWNAPLPKGGFALANDVKLTVELELVQA